jgi:hypothetical protein
LGIYIIRMCIAHTLVSNELRCSTHSNYDLISNAM